MSVTGVKHYSCSNCGGPLDVTGEESIVKCGFCGYVNEISRLEEEMAKFMEEVRGWLSSMGVTGGAAVDAVMRGAYFEDRIYPSLAVEFTNVVGDFVEPLDLPLVYPSFYRYLQDLQLDFDWDPGKGKPLQELAYKLSLPEVASFATTSKAKEKLKDLEFRGWLISLMLNIIDLGNRDDADSYIMAARSCDRLAEKTREMVNINEGDRKAYYEILADRLKLGSRYFRAMAHSATEKTKIPNELVEESNRLIEGMVSRLSGLAGAPRVDRIMFEEGLTRDRDSYRTVSAIFSLYSSLGGQGYKQFMESFGALVWGTILRPGPEVLGRVPEYIDVSWFTSTMDLPKLAWFSSTMEELILQHRVRFIIPKDFEKWAGKEAEGDYKVYLYPFYLLRVRTILKKGILFWRKGQENAFYALCDGAFNMYDRLFIDADYPSCLTPGFWKAFKGKLAGALENLAQVQESSPPPGFTILPPTVTERDVENLYRQAFIFREERDLLEKETGRRVRIPSSYERKGFDPGKVKAVLPEVISTIYLPLVVGERIRLAGWNFGLEDLPHRHLLAEEVRRFIQGRD